ncbi:MFS transporter [Roseateles paludis]|uniref:MFS transporter n=1 Tax=Roseateles paludis TaxID=3145238 RepID=A0ABV0FZV6_9BURK
MSRPRVVIALGLSQTLAWGSSFYLPALLIGQMSQGVGLAAPTVWAVFSGALVISAVTGPRAGARIDRWGGRSVLMGTNLVFAAGLALLALAQGPVGLCAAWLLLGVGMGAGLYDAAFATLARLYGSEARSAITGITLIAGFASTVGWPLTAWLEHALGWRGACWAWAALHLLIGLPLNASLPRAQPAHDAEAVPQAAGSPSTAKTPEPMAPVSPLTVGLLAWVFAVVAFTSTALAAHLPGLLALQGATPAAVVLAGSLLGPAQVAARLLEFGVLRRLHPLVSGRLAACMHPLAATLLMLLGAPAAAAFALLHGAGNGVLTITRGTLPLALFGPAGYGQRQGWLMLPGRLTAALAPWSFGVLLAGLGTRVLWVSAGLGLSAVLALMAIRPRTSEGT